MEKIITTNTVKLTDDQRKEVRAWVTDCVWSDDDIEETLDGMSDYQLVTAVNYHYAGGWEAFQVK